MFILYNLYQVRAVDRFPAAVPAHPAEGRLAAGDADHADQRLARRTLYLPFYAAIFVES